MQRRPARRTVTDRRHKGEASVSNSLYITINSPQSRRSVVALGLLEMLARQVGRIGVFRPIRPGDGKSDPVAETLVERYQLKPVPDAGLSYAEASALVVDGDNDPLVAHCVDAFFRIRDQYDFVIVLGTDFTGPSPHTELGLNAKLAANMGAPVLSIINGHEQDDASILTAMSMVAHTLADHDCSEVATFINRVDPQRYEHLRQQLEDEKHAAPVYLLRDLPVLTAMTVAEVFEAVSGTVLAGTPEGLEREVDSYMAGSGYLSTVLPGLTEGVLVVCHGDRDDLAVGAAAAALSPNLPTPAGVVLTQGHVPGPATLDLVSASGLPVVSVPGSTYETLHSLEGLHGQVHPSSRRKIAAALGEFAASVNTEQLASLVQMSHTSVVTPLMFTIDLLERARAARRRIVLPESGDERILRAADELLQGGVADLVLLGVAEDVHRRASQLGIDLSGVEIIDPVTSPLREEFADVYAELRKHKGMTRVQAYDTVSDVSYFGTLLVHTGRVDGMVSGAAHTTAHTIRPALEIIKTTPDAMVVSSAFLMCMPDRVLVFADCAVNPDPNAEQLADIAIHSADTAAAFGIEQRVAMVSYSTGTSGSGSDVDKVRAATEIVAQARPDLLLAGPIQYDAAVDPGVGASKLPGNPVAGHATVLIFPDLNTGNTTYKAVQRSADAIAVGPVLQGLRKPVNDLSRGCTIPDIVNTVAITAIQAQKAAHA